MVTSLEFTLHSEADTQHLAALFAPTLLPPQLIGFSGNLGAGKTTFIRAVLRANGVQGAIKSPTFALVESYPLPDYMIHHFDIYRLSHDAELDAFGFRDYCMDDAICFIEWPERIPSLNDYLDMVLSFQVVGDHRKLTIKGLTQSGQMILEGLKEIYK